MEPGKEILFFDQVDFVKSFCDVLNWLNANGGSEAAVTEKNENWMNKIKRMWGVSLWEKVFVENERKDLFELRKISNAIWERDVVFKGEGDGNFEKN